MVVEVDLENGKTLARVSLKSRALTLSFDPTPVFTFDAAGRVIGAFIGGRHYKRGLDNRVMEKHRAGSWSGDAASSGADPASWCRGRPGIRQARRYLNDRERGRFLCQVQEAAERIRRVVGTEGHASRCLPSTVRDRLGAWLTSAASWDEGRYQEDAARFKRVYGSIGILPPDQYLSVVVQVTEGCPWNRCSFCSIYRGKTYRVRPLDELRDHVREVVAFFGGSIGLRRSIFLADANALAVDQDGLLARMEVIREAIPPRRKGTDGMYSFLDTFTGSRKTPSYYRDLAGLGLKRVYIGLETGDDRLLKVLNKPGNSGQAVEVVSALKAGGVSAGVIVMVGAGGDRYAGDHVQGTIRAVNQMGLGRGDIIYFSEMVVHPGSMYERWSGEAGVRSLCPEGMSAQRAALKNGFRFSEPTRRPKMAAYDISEFLY